MPLKDRELTGKMEDFIKPIYSDFELNYGGLDVILGKDGKFYLIEINTQIGFANFARDMGERAVVEMYERILASCA